MSDEPKPRCNHIMESGARCGTPPLKDQPFCYYHRRWHTDFILPGHPAYVPPLLEDRFGIQLALQHVFLALSKNLLDRRLAQTMLSTIRLAQQNLRKSDNDLTNRYKVIDEINAPMREVVHLDDNLEDTRLRDAAADAHRASDTAARTAPVKMGVNDMAPVQLTTTERAIEASNDLAKKKFSPVHVPEFLPELDPDEWFRIASDLPPKGEPGTTQQQLNCRRVLRILNYDRTRRMMAGVKQPYMGEPLSS